MVSLDKDTFKAVSRSFYLSLKILSSQIQPAMSLGYLLCRAADSIADTELLPYEERLSTLKKYRALFDDFPISEDKTKALEANFLELIKDSHSAESRLLKQFSSLCHSLNQLSRTDQSLIAAVVEGVIKGMEMDLQTFGTTEKDLKALSKMSDLETYISLIGGEPGRFWTKLCLTHFPSIKPENSSQWIDDGIEFGKGLQMINILRDLPKDLQNGRCYIPLELLDEHKITPQDLVQRKNEDTFLTLYHQLIDKTLGHLKKGLSYMKVLPKNALRLRASVWWPMVLALKTLGRLRSSNKILDADHVIKVSKSEVYWLIGSSLFTLPSDKLLGWDFEDLATAASSPMNGKYKSD